MPSSREFIGSEVPSLVCPSYRREGAAMTPVDTGDRHSPVWRAEGFKERMDWEAGGLVRDRWPCTALSALALAPA